MSGTASSKTSEKQMTKSGASNSNECKQVVQQVTTNGNGENNEWKQEVRISSVNVNKSTFPEKTLNGKLHFLCGATNDSDWQRITASENKW